MKNQYFGDVNDYRKYGLLPRAKFFSDLLPDDKEGREAFGLQALQTLQRVDLLFFDPDNGLEIESVAKGPEKSNTHLYWKEVERAANLGVSMVIFQHRNRKKRQSLVRDQSSHLRSRFPGATVIPRWSPFVLCVSPRTAIALRSPWD
jgi:hypothetical protein